MSDRSRVIPVPSTSPSSGTPMTSRSPVIQDAEDFLRKGIGALTAFYSITGRQPEAVPYLERFAVYATDPDQRADAYLKYRLDLGRVGIGPAPRRLCTDAARDEGVIEWAYARSMC